MRHRRAIALALFVTVLWSSSWVIIRFGLDDEGLTPLTFAGLRYMSAALVLLAVAAARTGPRSAMRSLTRRDLAGLAAFGVVFVAVTQGAQFIALDHQPAATSSLVLSMSPLLVALAAGVSIGERASRRQLAGAVLVLAGAVMYFRGSLAATAIGMTAATVGLVANVVASLMGRSINRDLRRSPLVTTTVSMTFGAILLLAVGVAVEGAPEVSARAWGLILWLAVINTALAFTIWNHTMRHLSATESSAINNTMLIQIALLAWVFLGEVPGPIQIAGMLLVTAGVTLAQRLRATRPEASAGAAMDSPRRR